MREKLIYLVEIVTVLHAGPFKAAKTVHVPAIYRPQAIAHQRGTTSTGHYVTLVGSYNDGWCRYNDSNVSAATKADAFTSGAYDLSYAKRCEVGIAYPSRCVRWRGWQHHCRLCVCFAYWAYFCVPRSDKCCSAAVSIYYRVHCVLMSYIL